MIETKDVEIYVEEKRLLNKSTIQCFMDKIGGYLVALDHGVYSGYLNLEIWQTDCQNEIVWKTERVELTSEIFDKARAFYACADRSELLPVVSSEGKVLTFLQWNEWQERDNVYLDKIKNKIIDLLTMGNTIELRNWDEYTNFYYSEIKKRDLDTNVICAGRNWQLCNYYEENSNCGKFEGGGEIVYVTNEGIFFPLKEHKVYPLVCASDKYREKKIYAMIDHHGMVKNLWKLIFQEKIYISGFCGDFYDHASERLFGKPIKSIAEAASEKNALILVTSDSQKEKIIDSVSEDKILTLASGVLLKTDAQLWNCEIFQAYGGSPEAENRCRKALCGMNSFVFWHKVDDQKKTLLLWEYMEDKSSANYVKYIDSISDKPDWYSESTVYETEGDVSGLIKVKSFDLAIEEKRRIILYGFYSHYTNQWMHVLESFGLEFELMDDDGTKSWFGYRVGSIYDIAYYDIDKILVIVNKPYCELEDALDILSMYNITLENFNCISIYEMCKKQGSKARATAIYDLCAGPIFGKTAIKMANRDYPGYCVIGENNKDDYKIMVVGGSTSAIDLYIYESWTEILQKKFRNEGQSVTIYNGAVASCYSLQELIKVIRDAHVLKPDLIISYSGVNDIGETDRYLPPGYIDGVKKTRTLFDWLRNEKYIKNAAEEICAEFVCFAQPHLGLYVQSEKDKYERMFDETKDLMAADSKHQLKIFSSEYDWIVDLTDVFEGHRNVYIDSCHVTTEGNKIIADAIYMYIVDKFGRKWHGERGK